STEIAAHELGHMSGLRHADAFGPIGSGIFSGLDPSRYFPAYPGPGNATETRNHIMASPDSVGVSLFDSAATTYFGEREDIKMAVGDSGTTIVSAATPHTPVASAQALGDVPSLAVPNTLQPGSQNYGKSFVVSAVDVFGSLTIDANTGKATDDYYSFVGHAGELMNF